MYEEDRERLSGAQNKRKTRKTNPHSKTGWMFMSYLQGTRKKDYNLKSPSESDFNVENTADRVNLPIMILLYSRSYPKDIQRRDTNDELKFRSWILASYFIRS
ncbi:hypothetical protein NPIL_174561 [Nephila pilipes]|uniref:Uncharacterized protein n=1 Tax=Nephila pilipes TaxID=299642 RepID=A0A8X6UP01_NEPPI|nr:hypothetical protein NPIL_174561 [Nephila pilipes]